MTASTAGLPQLSRRAGAPGVPAAASFQGHLLIKLFNFTLSGLTEVKKRRKILVCGYSRVFEPSACFGYSFHFCLQKVAVT